MVGQLLASGVYRVVFDVRDGFDVIYKPLGTFFSRFSLVKNWTCVACVFSLRSCVSFPPKSTALARFSEVHLMVVVAQSRPSWIQVAVSS